VIRPSSLGLIVLCAIIPLYGTLAELDPTRPPIPRVVPDGVATATLVVVLAALVAIAPAAARAARRDALTFALLIGGIDSLVASLVGFDPVVGVGAALLILGVGAAGLALARDADGATLRACVRAFLISGAAGSLLALAMAFAHRPAAVFAYYNGRAVGTFLNPNELAAYTLMGLAFALPLAWTSRGRDRLAVGAAVVFALTLGATFSRWGVLSAVCGIVAYAALTRARGLLLGALAVAVLGVGLDIAAGARHHNPRDTEARTVAWQAGLTTIARFPLTGVGLFAYGRTYDAVRPPDAPGSRTPVAFDPHSLPIAYAAEGGMLVLVSLIASLAIVLRQVVGTARSSVGTPRGLAFGITAGLVALLVDGGINTVSIFLPLYLQMVPLALGVVRTDAL
jgi:O-antigen ligase